MGKTTMGRTSVELLALNPLSGDSYVSWFDAGLSWSDFSSG